MSVFARSAPSTAPSPERLPSPAALRARRRGWRDPRAAVGLLLVVGSVLVGARVLASADDTVLVMAASRPLAAGQVLAEDDLGQVRLRFSSEEDAGRYLPGGSDLPDGAVLLRPVGAGELLPREAVATGEEGRLVDVPLRVDPALVPSGVGRGTVVDVWVAGAPGTGTGSAPGPRQAAPGDGGPLLRAVPVLSASRGAATGVGGLQQVVVGVPVDDEPDVARVVARLGEEATFLLVRRSG